MVALLGEPLLGSLVPRLVPKVNLGEMTASQVEVMGGL